MSIERDAPSAVKELIDNSNLMSSQDQEILFEELGRRVKLLETEPSFAGSLSLPIEPSAEAVGDFFSELGKRVFERVHRELYQIICGNNPSDEIDRKKVKEAFGLSEEILISALVGVIISSLGVAPVLATVVAALLIKRVLKPAYEETCLLWQEYLE